METEAVSTGAVNTLLHGTEVWAILLRIAVIIIATLAIVQLYKKLSRRNRNNNKIHLKFIRNILVLFFYMLGIINVMAQIPAFSKVVSTLLAGSGILALTIGLAAQESLGNAINGLFISMFRPFEVGDRVRLINGNITGYIEDITLRHTVIRTFMNSRIIVPNTTMNKDMLENSNFMNARASGFIDLTITYHSNLELAQSLIAKAITEHPSCLHDLTDSPGDAEVRVYVRDLGQTGVELRASMWTSDINDNFEACSEVRQVIKLAFDAAGIEFAYNGTFGGSKKE